MTRSTHAIAAVAALAGLLTACSDGADRPLTAAAGASADGSARPTDPSAADGEVKAPRPGKIAQTDEFGEVTAVRDVDGTLQVDVDRVDMLGGAEAQAAAAAAGDEINNDYYVVNDNPRVRTYRLSAEVVVWGDIGFGHPGNPQRVTADEWRRFVATQQGRQTLFHFDLEDGAVVGIEEQYRP